MLTDLVKNFIFEALELKTTQIQIEIDEDGELLHTKLIDRGTRVYELLEKNPYPNILHNVRVALFHLNQAAKATFTRRMGVRIFDYGSVFLYKNGFRIHPFGDRGDDSLKIDYRKNQGFFRRLGLRDLSGRIEINGDNPDFQETSSRDGGLINNEAFESLKALFYDFVLQRLENYVIELAKFGKGLESWPELADPESSQLREISFDIIGKLIQSEDVIAIDYDPDVLDILENKSSKSVTTLLRNLKRISADQEDDQLLNEISKAEKQVALLRRAKEEAEKETERERKRAKQAEQDAKEAFDKVKEAEELARRAQEEVQENKSRIKDLRTQTLFLQSTLSTQLDHLQLEHSIGQDARSIEQFASHLLNLLLDSHQDFKPEKFKAVLERISYVARKIITVSRMATRANFKADAEDITADLVAYIREYLLNIFEGFVLDPYHKRIEIEFNASDNVVFITQFTPINVSIVFDNLISNSRKHKAKTIFVDVIEQKEDELVISFKDDGDGVPKKHRPFVFDVGFTTTDGSGLGLYHSQNIMKEMQGSIEINKENKDGTEFILTFVKHKDEV